MMSNSMLAPARRARIIEALERDGTVRVSQLTEELGVTPVTLRRDLAQLEQEGQLVRVHGGAVAADEKPEEERFSGTGTTGTIAVLVPSLDYYWPGVVRGMEQEAQQHGLRILLRGASYEVQDERPMLQRLARSEGVRGLLVAPNTETTRAQDVLHWLAECDVPSVLVERDTAAFTNREPPESVTTDHALGAGLAARHLATLGHRRTGLVLSRHSPTSRKIAAGWHAAATQLQLESGFETLLPDRRSPEFSAAVNATLDAALAERRTALLVHSDPEAMAVIDLALARGIQVPGELSVVAYDDEVAELFSPGLTAVSPPRSFVGRAAVELLAKRIADPARPSTRVVLSPRLVIRESTSAPRSAGA